MFHKNSARNAAARQHKTQTFQNLFSGVLAARKVTLRSFTQIFFSRLSPKFLRPILHKMFRRKIGLFYRNVSRSVACSLIIVKQYEFLSEEMPVFL